MKIRYLGHSSFEITSKSGTVVITDPYQGVGYSMPQGLRADIVTLSHNHYDHNYIEGVSAKKILSDVTDFVGDGVEIHGIDTYHDGEKGALRGKNTIYKITVDGIILCHMGDIGEECSVQLAEKIGKVDLLFIPVGGRYTVDAVGAKKYIDAIAPRTVIPMHYRPADGTLDIAGIQPFFALCVGEKITFAQNGVVQFEESPKGILYMERVG